MEVKPPMRTVWHGAIAFGIGDASSPLRPAPGSRALPPLARQPVGRLGDHPRGCGEQHVAGSPARMTAGRSPRQRGWSRADGLHYYGTTVRLPEPSDLKLDTSGL